MVYTCLPIILWFSASTCSSFWRFNSYSSFLSLTVVGVTTYFSYKTDSDLHFNIRNLNCSNLDNICAYFYTTAGLFSENSNPTPEFSSAISFNWFPRRISSVDLSGSLFLNSFYFDLNYYGSNLLLLVLLKSPLLCW